MLPIPNLSSRSVALFSAALLVVAALLPRARAASADDAYEAYQAASKAWSVASSKLDEGGREKKIENLWAMEKAAFAEQSAALSFIKNHPTDPRRWIVIDNLRTWRPRFVKDWGPLNADGKAEAIVIDTAAAQVWSKEIADLKQQMANASDLPEELVQKWEARVAEANHAKVASEQFERKWIGNPLAPDFTVTDATGRAIKLSDYRGKVVVLDFWATWCGPCQAAMPHNEEVAARYDGEGVVVLCVCTMDARPKFEAWVKANASKYPHLIWAFDATGKKGISSELYSAPALPTQFIIDREGRVTGFTIGYLEGESILEARLAEAGLPVEAKLREKGQAEIEARHKLDAERQRPVEKLRELLRKNGK
jgi:thiol-disulfide isomerase/thioredoxin